MVAATRNPHRSLGTLLYEALIAKPGEGSDVERGQALSRVIMVPIIDTYIVIALFLSGKEMSTVAWWMLAYSVFYIPVSWAILYWTIKRPGYNFPRRVFTIVNDYAAMIFAMSSGGAITLPVYALVLWVTVGNGLRYGPRYLVAATIVALISIATCLSFNAYLRENPFLVLTLMLTTVLVPAYIYGLLARLRQAYDLALEANLAKSRFLAQASHDLRQPIHAISLYTAWLRDARLGREQRQVVEKIDRSLHSVSGLFRSLLDISTLDSGNVMPKRGPVAIGALIKDIVRQNEQAAQWAKVSLRAAPTDFYVDSDEILLTTMIQNLVTNALKYAPGKPVLVGCRRKGGRLTVAVYDQGEGIAEEHLPHVFEEFYRVRERGDRDIEGVGLGLPIVRRLGQLLELHVCLKSVQGRGTAALIEGLPIVEAPPIVLSEQPRLLPTITVGLRVLLVEDDEDVLSATAALLARWGCDVQAEAITPTKIGACDVLITDYDLGQKQTGSDCIALVRGLTRREVPAIVMTGHDETRVRADINDPAIPILSKPVRPAELRSTLTTLMLKARESDDSL